MKSMYVFFIEYGFLILVEGVIVKNISSYIILEFDISQFKQPECWEL